MSVELNNRISGIVDNLRSYQILMYIGKEELSPRIQSRLILVRDSSPSGLEEVLMALRDSKVQLVVYSNDVKGVENLLIISKLVKGLSTPIVLGEDNSPLDNLPVSISKGKVASPPKSYASIDYVLLTRANQLVGKLNIPYNGFSSCLYLRELDLMYKRKVLECIDWVLGNNSNELNSLHTKDTSQFISRLFRITNVEHIHGLILNI